MIDPLNDKLINRHGVSKLIKKQTGKSLNHGSVMRWFISGGPRGIKLESIKIRGERFTTELCLQRFFQAINVPTQAPVQVKSAARSRAKKRLAKAGI